MSRLLILILLLNSFSCHQSKDVKFIDNLKWKIYLAMLNCKNNQDKNFYELQLEPIKKVRLEKNIITYEFRFYDKDKPIKKTDNYVIYSIAEVDSTTNKLLHLTGENVIIKNEDLMLRNEDRDKFKDLYQNTPNKIDHWLKKEIQKRLF